MKEYIIDSALLAFDDAGIPKTIARYYLIAIAHWAMRPESANIWHVSRYALAIAGGIEKKSAND